MRRGRPHKREPHRNRLRADTVSRQHTSHSRRQTIEGACVAIWLFKHPKYGQPFFEALAKQNPRVVQTPVLAQPTDQALIKAPRNAKLRLKVNEAKSAVARPQERKFRTPPSGFGISTRFTGCGS